MRVYVHGRSTTVPSGTWETTMPGPQTSSDARDRKLVGDMLRHAGARPADVLMVAGGGHAGLLLELCRRGFTEVCLATARCPGARETVDLLWLPHASAEPLADRLHGFAGALREGGTIVLHGDVPTSRDRVAALWRLLLTIGLRQ
jgi:hypothetical protein